MTAISPIRIHKPDSCHGWGIDFNYERPFWDARILQIETIVED